MRSTPFTIACDLPLGGMFSALMRPALQADIVIDKGAVPEWLDFELGERALHVEGDTILMRFDKDHSFLIEGGERVIHSNGPKTAAYITGPVFGALCYQRGLIPFHASAVVNDGKVHAFTGLQPAGESPITLRLVRDGWTFFTDDILVVDPQISKDIACYAIQRQRKPSVDAVNYPAATPQGETYRREREIKQSVGAKLAPNEETQPFRAKCDTLFSVSLIDETPEASIGFEPISGANTIRTLIGGLYLPHFATRIQSRVWLFRSLAALAQTIPVERLKYPVTWDCSPESSVQISEHLASLEANAVLEGSE